MHQTHAIPVAAAVTHPKATAPALNFGEVSLRAVMGLNPQPGPNGIAIDRCHPLRPGRKAEILQGTCEVTPVMTRHLRTGEIHQQGFGFTALMQGDFALQQLPAQICLRRPWNGLIQRETVTRCDECTHAHRQQT